MKYPFQKEEHNRQDKVKKGDYLEDIRERRPTSGNWSGVSLKKMELHSIKKLELKRAELLFFVYGKWLYQNTKKLSHFARLNAAHSSPENPEIEAAFHQCSKDWANDYPKIILAIKKAPVTRPKGAPKWLPALEFVAWNPPSDIIADEVWRKMPPKFQCKSPAKKTAE